MNNDLQWMVDIPSTPTYNCTNGDTITIGTIFKRTNSDNGEWVVVDMDLGNGDVRIGSSESPEKYTTKLTGVEKDLTRNTFYIKYV